VDAMLSDSSNQTDMTNRKSSLATRAAWHAAPCYSRINERCVVICDMWASELDTMMDDVGGRKHFMH
jgi:hypothetical protein